MVLCRQIVAANGEIRPSGWSQRRRGKRGGFKCQRVEDDCVHIVIAVRLVSLHIKKEAPAVFDNGPAEIASVSTILIRRLEAREGIPRVQGLVVEVDVEPAVKSI